MRKALILAVILFIPQVFAAPKVRAPIIDGQNNHDWQHATQVLRKVLEETGLIEVDLPTSPPKGADFSGFGPEFGRYRVVISNYNDFAGGTVRPPTCIGRLCGDGGKSCGALGHDPADR